MSALQSHYFDKSKIEKVVLNLLSNAIKFTPPGGKITMQVWDEGRPLPDPLLSKERVAEGRVRSEEGAGGEGAEGVLKISVIDTGIGIPEDKLPHIFERFMQVDTSSTRAHGGMGIGLSLVKDFVELHGGRVEVESEFGKGSKFTITLPRGKEHFRAAVVETAGTEETAGRSSAALIEAMRETRWSEEDVEGLPAEALAEAGEGATVLIVDDNADMRRAIREVLKDHYQVIFARDGEEGVRVAREKKPDLIVSDVMMPKKDGYGLLQDLKGDPQTREIPVILLTAKSGEENLLAGFQHGADDYITKPFSPKEVLSRVRNLIRLRRQAEEIERQAETTIELASQVAHDIRSPLSSIRAAIDNLKESPDKAGLPGREAGNRADFINLLELSARRLNGIAEDLLKNRGDGKKAKLVFSIHRVLDELVGEYSALERAGKIRFKKDFNHSINCLGDPERIQRAFGNILKNAVEAIDGKGEICLKSVIRDGVAIVSIADTGRGMGPEALSSILEGKGYTAGKKEGHGIGMRVVREVVGEHGWRLEADSEPGRGTTFRIKFPMPDSKSLEGVLPREEGAGSFELRLALGETLAVIDDDPSVRLQWEMIAERKQFPVRVYKSWEDFQKRRVSERTAVVDYHFENSEIDGLEIIRRLKGQGLDNLYLCTAEYWKPVIQERARGLGVTICPKPIPKIVVIGPSLVNTPRPPLTFPPKADPPLAERGGGLYNVLVIDDDPLIGVTWKALRERLKIRNLHFFTNLEAFIASGIDSATLDIAFVDLHLKKTRYDGNAVAAYLKENKLPRVVIASGEKSESKIPESIEGLM